jgi:nicotinamidase/pyrazinamidase
MDPTPYDERTALLVVDVQNDFADPQGSLAVDGGERIVTPIGEEIGRALAAGAFVVLTQDWHPPDTPHFAKDGGVWPVHCVGGTWGARLHPDLPVPPSTDQNPAFLRKGTDGRDGYSAFSVRHPDTGESAPTELEGMLRGRGIERVVIVGLATDYCVLQTVLDARRLGFDAEVRTDLIAAVDREPGDGTRALEAIAKAGATLA